MESLSVGIVTNKKDGMLVVDEKTKKKFKQTNKKTLLPGIRV